MNNNKDSADKETYSEKATSVVILAILLMLLVSAWWAYGSPMPLIKYLVEGDEIAWKAVWIILGYIIIGFGIVYVYTWVYDRFLGDEKSQDSSSKHSSK